MTDPLGPPLGRVTYDRDGLRRTDDGYLAEAWPRARVLVISPKSATPVDEAGRLLLRAPDAVADDAPRRYLGLIDDVPYFAATVEADDTGSWRTLREFGAAADDLDAALVASAIALEQWHQRHPRCSVCGAPTKESHAGWTRTCPVDDSQHFPRTDPAVIMLIHDGDDLALLGRSPQWPPGRFSTLAGFVEPGETLEAAVAREVFEEVGVATTDIRYVASQPWPFPASLMLGFIGRLDGEPDLHLDPVEMADAGWFTREEIRAARDWEDEDGPPRDGRRLLAIPPKFSISRFLIERWLDGET